MSTCSNTHRCGTCFRCLERKRRRALSAKMPKCEGLPDKPCPNAPKLGERFCGWCAQQNEQTERVEERKRDARRAIEQVREDARAGDGLLTVADALEALLDLIEGNA